MSVVVRVDGPLSTSLITIDLGARYSQIYSDSHQLLIEEDYYRPMAIRYLSIKVKIFYTINTALG